MEGGEVARGTAHFELSFSDLLFICSLLSNNFMCSDGKDCNNRNNRIH